MLMRATEPPATHAVNAIRVFLGFQFRTSLFFKLVTTVENPHGTACAGKALLVVHLQLSLRHREQ